MISNAGLIMRQYAFWNRNKWIGWGLGILLVLTGVAGVATGVHGFMGMKPVPKLGPGLPTGCYLSPPTHIWANFIGIMVFDTVLFSVTVTRAWRLLRDTGRSLMEPSPIIRHLLKTGTWYFLIVFVTTLITFASSLLNNNIMYEADGARSILPAVTSIICSRLLLYIRSDLADAKTPHLQTKATSQWPNSPVSPEVENMFRHTHLRWDDSIQEPQVGGENSGGTVSSDVPSSEGRQQLQTLMSLPSVVIDADDCAPSRLNHYVDSRSGSREADVEWGRSRRLDTFGERRDASGSGWSRGRTNDVDENPPGRAS
ncbi:hypothetical protein BKA62DRAFT_619431 [Auriculariales sp. MPI-PUGE-AT-0066]|nr:hypothetical protein BKA62DRAFT_619431 [Auriculariales sp. MPI-PUGE-AT-0066]